MQQLAVLNDDVYRARKRIGDLLGKVTGDAAMQDLQGVDEVLEGVEKGLGEETRVLRHLMSALRPPVLDNRGFAEALTEHGQRTAPGRAGDGPLPDHAGVADQRGQARQGRAVTLGNQVKEPP